MRTDWSPRALLVRMWRYGCCGKQYGNSATYTTILHAILYYILHTYHTTTWSSNSVPGNWKQCPEEIICTLMFTAALSTTVKRQKQPKWPFDGGMNKQSVVYPSDGELNSLKQENSDTGCMDGPWAHYTNKPGTKRQILHDSTGVRIWSL